MTGNTIGVYLCRCGGNISDVVDVETVANAARDRDGVDLVSIQDYLCSSSGQEAIEEDIRAGNAERVVIRLMFPETSSGDVQKPGTKGRHPSPDAGDHESAGAGFMGAS